MIKQKDILDAYVFLRRHNHSIPDEVLDFIKESSLNALDKPETMSDTELKPCPIRMIEIYSGKDPEWKGWHNLIKNDEHGYPYAGPLSPSDSEPFLKMIEAYNTRTNANELIEKIKGLRRYSPNGDSFGLDQYVLIKDLIEAIKELDI